MGEFNPFANDAFLEAGSPFTGTGRDEQAAPPAEPPPIGGDYITGTQATLWVGDAWVDEATGIQFQAFSNKTPLYGYASTHYDAIAPGRAIVQGLFQIHFVENGYLYAALAEEGRRQARVTGSDRPDRDEAAVEERIRRLREIESGSAGPLDPGSGADLERQRLIGEIAASMATLDVASIDAIAHRRRRAAGEDPSSRNAIYSNVPFRLTGMFGRPGPRAREAGTFREIRDCVLTSNEMIVGDNDSIVMERYGFIGRLHI